MLLDRTWKSIYKRISWTWLPVIGLNRLYRKIRQVMKCNSAHKFCSISVFFFGFSIRCDPSVWVLQCNQPRWKLNLTSAKPSIEIWRKKISSDLFSVNSRARLSNSTISASVCVNVVTNSWIQRVHSTFTDSFAFPDSRYFNQIEMFQFHTGCWFSISRAPIQPANNSNFSNISNQTSLTKLT